LARFVLGPTVPALVTTVVLGGSLHLLLLWRSREVLDLSLSKGRSVPIRSG
jgi:hypothetical protein